MRYNAGYNREGEYDHYVVSEPMPLLEWLLANVPQSKTKIKATLQGRGIKVNGKTVSQFDFPLEKGMKIAVSKTKRNQRGFKSRWVECEDGARRLFQKVAPEVYSTRGASS